MQWLLDRDSGDMAADVRRFVHSLLTVELEPSGADVGGWL
jgi:hypothetical protein